MTAEREQFAKHLAKEVEAVRIRERIVGFLVGLMFGFAVCGFVAAAVVGLVRK